MNQRRISPHKVKPLIIFCATIALLSCLACVKLPRRINAANAGASATPATQIPTLTRGNKPAPQTLIDINRATREELAKLPGIGEGFAARICEHRARYGAFRRAEHLLMVRGISERRYARVRPFVTVE
jgi:competence ComEA-like helix-hairpin-helix protein